MGDYPLDVHGPEMEADVLSRCPSLAPILEWMKTATDNEFHWLHLWMMCHEQLLDGRFIRSEKKVREERETIMGHIQQLREKVHKHGEGPRTLEIKKEARNRFIDGLLKKQHDDGVPVGQEDWVRIRDAVYDKNKEWLKGKKPELMESKDLKRAYRRDRPAYNEDCKKPWKRRKTPG
jgi:hypothetical protein